MLSFNKSPNDKTNSRDHAKGQGRQHQDDNGRVGHAGLARLFRLLRNARGTGHAHSLGPVAIAGRSLAPMENPTAPPNDTARCVTTLSDFRRIALSMPETEELNGMGYPNFRTGRKSFATIEDTMAVIRLTRDQQATFVATAPEVFAPDSSGWGRLGNTVIRLELADEATVQVAVATAWSNVAVAGNASEVVDAADVETANELVNMAEVVDAGCTAEVADVGIGDAAEVNATVVKVVNAGEVADEVSAAAFVNVAGVVEVGDAAEVADEVSSAASESM